MTPQELKNSISQLAIQGKLVEQRAEEGTGEDLCRQIQAEKQKLIKEGKIKKDKPLPEITEDEKPFDIPKSWKWVQLDDIVYKQIKRGKSPTYTSKSGTLVFAQKCNTKKGIIDISLALYLDESKLSNYPEEELMRDKDIVINSTGGGTMGRVGFYQNKDNPDNIPIVPDSHVTIVRVAENVCAEYALYVIKTYQPYLEKQGSGSTNQTELNATVIRTLSFPLPPLAEQKRIVAKIEELLPLIDRYEQAWSKLEDFNRRFPTDMQKAILQMAIEGKLVEQRPEEGTGEDLYRQIQAEKQKLIKEGKIKKDKPLPEITEDEKPFDIPESWMWVRLRAVVYNRGQITPNSTFSYIDIGSIDNIHQRLNEEENIVDAEKAPSRARKIVEYGDILYSTVRPYLHNMCIIDKPFSCTPIASTGFAAMVCYEGLYNKYLFNYLMSPAFDSYANDTENAKGVAYPAINDDKLYKSVIPLPPLAEQKRIVEKLNQLLPLCEKLK